MSHDLPRLDDAIRSYYDRRPEEKRLSQGASQIEAARSKELIQRFAPDPPAVVLDVGGAAGAYSFWLAAKGYEVHLVDPVQRLVDLASARNEDAPRPLASAEVGDARSLEVPDGAVDMVLLLGPLYHLTTAGERATALSEAARVLKAGGLLFAACITRWASLFNGLVHDRLADPAFVTMMERDLETGQHRNPDEFPGYFTTAYFHTPDEFRAELTDSGLGLLGVYGLEGPAGLLGDFEERWADSRKREDLIRAAREIEEEPTLMGLSPHLLGVGRKR